MTGSWKNALVPIGERARRGSSGRRTHGAWRSGTRSGAGLAALLVLLSNGALPPAATPTVAGPLPKRAPASSSPWGGAPSASAHGLVDSSGRHADRVAGGTVGDGRDDERSIPRLEVDVRARAIAPGEALRIVVRGSIPLTEVEGSFLGRPLFFSPVPLPSRASGNPRGAPATTNLRSPPRVAVLEWSAWAAVDLERRPGKVALEVRGRTEDGRDAAGTRTLTVAAKTFPKQSLKVEEKFVTPPPEVEERIERERSRLDGIYGSRRSARPPADPFVRPVAGEPTGVFGTRRFFNEKPRSPHPGLDLRAATGTHVAASGPGVVALAADLYFSGNTVVVDHGGGLFTIYAHLSTITVAEGDTVGPGRIVGLSGATGRVTGPHLHWGARIGDRIVDPSSLLSPALLP